MSGYLGSDGQPADPGKWLRTGDLGRIDEDGFLFVVGRVRDMVVCGGFDDARIPLENVLGQVGEGWKVATTTLLFERSTAFAATVIGLQRVVAELADKYSSNPILVDRLQQLSDDVFAARALLYKNVSEQQHGDGPGPASSALKLIATELNYKIRKLAALADLHEIEDYFESFGLRIGGGPSEVQRNILAERVLGLPKEPRR